MQARHLYIIPALVFAVAAAFKFNDNDALYWIGIFSFLTLANILAAINKLNYTVIISGFLLFLFLITKDFPPIEKWGLTTEEGIEIISLIIGCNWMGLLGVLKLYNDAYK
ncbi:MAG: transmembrane 220 family protein [Bacteroidia bacterium]